MPQLHFQRKIQQFKLVGELKKFLLEHGGNTDSVQFMFSNGLSEHYGSKVGFRDFNLAYVVPENDEVKCVRFGLKLVNGYY